ncbi:hypothetical protein GA0115239_102443 [Streptomyces sp. BpilaLS-43]|nr:hypothetical protein GA0115239_102443 [Streptomyces sp. BpilaLS-43]
MVRPAFEPDLSQAVVGGARVAFSGQRVGDGVLLHVLLRFRCNSAACLGMRWGGALLGNGTRPGDVRSDTEAVARAKTFFS